MFSILLLLSASLSSAAPVSVSILSLLSPKSVQLMLKTPGQLTIIPTGSEPPVHRNMKARDTLEIEWSNGLLLLNHKPAARSARLSCPGGCLSDLRVPGKERPYHGDLEFSAGNNTITIVLYIDIEELTASILESEGGGAGSPESMRAMAVAVRTFLEAGRRHTESDFCDTTHCQVFQGLPAGKPASAAVSSTSGLVLEYHGRVFRPYYSRNCGGRTATYQDVWGEPSPDYPFFAVDCPCARTAGNEWTTRLPFRQLAEITGMTAPRLERSGLWMILTNNNETRRYSVENFRMLLGRTGGWATLPGNHFKVGQESGAWVFHGRGAGHGVGFCQDGAEVLARDGKDFRQILRTYLPETNIEVL